jgi:phospholipase/carboxylesterase
MELSAMDPDGRAEARALLAELIGSLARPGRRIVLAGFSQGGMLAMDYVLHAEHPPAALALLSSTQIAITDWQPRAHRLAGLRVLVAHGEHDAELAFRAGELLRDFAIAGGAHVTWLPFDGGHELPLPVWRALRRLLRET